jgi:hypothetical protein
VGEYINFAQTLNNTLELGKNYRATIDIIHHAGEGVKVGNEHNSNVLEGVIASSQPLKTTGVHTINFMGDGGNVITVARRSGGDICNTTVRSISVKEILPSWEVSDYVKVIPNDPDADLLDEGEDYEYTTEYNIVQDSDFSQSIGQTENTTGGYWNTGSGWSIITNPQDNNEGIAIAVEGDNYMVSLVDTPYVQARKSYEVKYTISSYIAGKVRILAGTGSGYDHTPFRDEDGDYTEVLVMGSDVGNGRLYIRGEQEDGPNFTGSISNVELREIYHERNANLSDIDGTEMIVNGGFDTDTAWNKNDNWTIAGGVAVSDGTVNASINQSDFPGGDAEIGETYELSFEIKTLTKGPGYKVRIGSGGVYSEVFSEIGFHTYKSKCLGPNTNIYINTSQDSSGNITTGTIDNVSLKKAGLVKVTKTNNKDWRSAFVKQPIDYVEGEEYAVKFKAKVGSMSNPKITVRDNFGATSGNIVKDLTITSDWEEYSYSFVADSDSSDISFSSSSWESSGEGEYFFIDSVSVQASAPGWNLNPGLVVGARAATWEDSKARIKYEVGIDTTNRVGISQDILTPGLRYKVMFDVEEIHVGSKIKVFNDNINVSGGHGGGSHAFVFTAIGETIAFYRQDPDAECDVYIDNISVRPMGVVIDKTISFNEKSKGWSSFKSFVPETGLSINDEYLTGREARVWSHHIPPAVGTGTPYANNFYGVQYTSTVDILFNDNPSSVKGFGSINYEGTQAKITQFITKTEVVDAAGNNVINDGSTGVVDGEYYNLNPKDGWYVESFDTDLQEARVDEFINREGKWFNHVNGVTTNLNNLDTREFTVQGIGISDSVTSPEVETEEVVLEKVTLTIQENND